MDIMIEQYLVKLGVLSLRNKIAINFLVETRARRTVSVFCFCSWNC